MSQDKEYIPEWKQPHINKKYVSFDLEGHFAVKKDAVLKVELTRDLEDDRYDSILDIHGLNGEELYSIARPYNQLINAYQSILDQLNQ